MRPVRVARRKRRVRLDESTPSGSNRLYRTVQREPGHTTPTAGDDSDKARNAPLHAFAQRRNPSVQTLRAWQRQFVRGPVLAPADGLAAVVDQNPMRPAGLDERTLLSQILDPCGRAIWKRLPIEVATALVKHASTERPSPTRFKQSLEIGPRFSRKFFRGVWVAAFFPSVERQDSAEEVRD